MHKIILTSIVERKSLFTVVLMSWTRQWDGKTTWHKFKFSQEFFLGCIAEAADTLNVNCWELPTTDFNTWACKKEKAANVWFNTLRCACHKQSDTEQFTHSDKVLAAELSYNQNQCSVNFISAQRYSNSNQHWILPERFTGRLLPLCRLVTYQFSLLKENTHLHIFLVPSPLSIFSSKCGDSFLTDTYHQKSWGLVSAVSQEVIPMSLCLTCTQHTHLVVWCKLDCLRPSLGGKRARPTPKVITPTSAHARHRTPQALSRDVPNICIGHYLENLIQTLPTGRAQVWPAGLAQEDWQNKWIACKRLSLKLASLICKLLHSSSTQQSHKTDVTSHWQW